MASDAPAAAAAPAVVKSPVDGRWTVDMFTDAFDEPVTCERGGGAKRAVGGEAARATRGTGIRPPPPHLSRPPPSCPGLISYFLPCVQYGFNAERVQGGDCVSHGLKYYLYSCICSCGVSGV